jgi:hypothetical protein
MLQSIENAITDWRMSRTGDRTYIPFQEKPTAINKDAVTLLQSVFRRQNLTQKAADPPQDKQSHQGSKRIHI